MRESLRALVETEEYLGPPTPHFEFMTLAHRYSRGLRVLGLNTEHPRQTGSCLDIFADDLSQ